MVKCITIGSLRKRVEIQQRVRTADGVGGWSNSWLTTQTVYANIEPVSAKEALFGMQNEHTISHRITIRYTEGFTADYRVKFGSRTFDIKGIRNIEERERFMILDCLEGGAI